jgi:hypothetical protein
VRLLLNARQLNVSHEIAQVMLGDCLIDVYRVVGPALLLRMAAIMLTVLVG